MFLHVLHRCCSKYRRVLVKCCTKEIVCAHRLCKIRGNIDHCYCYCCYCCYLGLELLKVAIEKAGYTGKIEIGMDVAASEFFKDKKYDLDFKNPKSDPATWVGFIWSLFIPESVKQLI